MKKSSQLDRILTLELARVTEAAAVSASALVGRGDEMAADQAAVDAMRRALNKMSIEGTVVIGEGERDQAPMLYIGEKVGTGRGPKVDIALDPLEGTTICAKSMPNSLAVVALAEHGHFLNAPDVYMEKIAVGGAYPAGTVDLDADPRENVTRLARAKGVEINEITACVLDRPRHADLIGKLREIGVRVKLIGDGDVAGVIDTTNPEETGVDIYMGIGGAPEGVLAAAALRCTGGQMQGRLVFPNEESKARAHKMGITKLDRKYSTEEMAQGDVVFSATGVTDGSMLSGVKRGKAHVVTHTIVMRSSSKTIRWIKARHTNLEKFL